MRNVYVLGVGMVKFGRYPEREVHELAAEAALLALDDAGMSIQDIQFLASGNLFQANRMIGQRLMQQVGQTGIPVVNVSNACATGSTAVREAYFGVASGEYDIAMAVGSEQMGKRRAVGHRAREARALKVSWEAVSCRPYSVRLRWSICANTEQHPSTSPKCR